MIKLSTLVEQREDTLQQQQLEFRSQLKDALLKDGGLQDGELGVQAQQLVTLWMENPRSLLDADTIEFIIDDETLFNDQDLSF